MTTPTRRALLCSAAASAALPLAAPAPVRAQPAGDAIRIGVLTDMSGPYRDISGPNVVVMARQAVQDSGAAARGLSVEILQADHQHKADVGVNIARQWFDQGVDAILDVNNSAIAMAINGLAREKNKVHLNSAAASADLTGAGIGLGVRTTRYAVVLDDLKVTYLGVRARSPPEPDRSMLTAHVQVEEDPTQVTVSGAEAVLAAL